MCACLRVHACMWVQIVRKIKFKTEKSTGNGMAKILIDLFFSQGKKQGKSDFLFLFDFL